MIKAHRFWARPIWSLLPVAIVCGVFAEFAIQTQRARVELKKQQSELAEVQRLREELNREIQRLQSERNELFDTNQDLRSDNEKKVKELSELRSEADALWKIAAKDHPDIVSGKVINLLEADSPRQKAQLQFLAGKFAMAHHDYERARTLFDSALAQYPQYAEALNSLGLVAEKLRDKTNAERAYRQAISVDPGYIYPYQNLALLLLDRKDYARARTLAEQALKINPDYKPMKEILARANSDHTLSDAGAQAPEKIP